MASGNGTKYENALSNILEDDHGYASLPAGASGSRTERERPDVMAGRDGHAFAIEVKQAKDGVVYLDPHEIPDLLNFAERFGATAVVAVRPSFQYKKFDHWLIYPADTVRKSGGESHVINEEDHDRGQSISEFFGGGQ